MKTGWCAEGWGDHQACQDNGAMVTIVSFGPWRKVPCGCSCHDAWREAERMAVMGEVMGA